MQYRATYICQSIKKHIARPGLLKSNTTCDTDWFSFNNSDKCISVSQTNEPVSYDDVNLFCHALNSSILSVYTSERDRAGKRKSNELRDTITTGLVHLQAMYDHQVKIPDDNDSVLHTMLFGQPLDVKSTNNLLPYTLRVAMYNSTPNYTFLASLNNMCVSLQFSPISFYFDEGGHFPTKGWGVKCVSCSARVHVSAVICERPAKQYDLQCENNHFQCNDQTCILLIYVCDLTPDCFDGSDEDNCSLDIANVPVDRYVFLPCISDSVCNLNGQDIIPIHAICDGLYSNNSILQEDVFCPPYEMKHLNMLQVRKLDHLFKNNFKFPTNMDTAKLYMASEYLRCYVHVNPRDMTDNISDTTTTFLRDFIRPQIAADLYCTDINQLCKVSIHNPPCQSKTRETVCKDIRCPGMFKCYNYFCIEMSMVCDGQHDCKHGEDEEMCTNLTCPGLLKCRGEKRCVSPNEICDNHVDCLHSKDDEIECHICPVDCKCEGYVLVCDVYNSLNMIAFIDVSYIKGILVQGVQHTLILQHIHLPNLIYVNFSSSELQFIILNKAEYFESYVIITDISNNQLSKVSFLRSNFFIKIRYLDLSFNLITEMIFGDYLSLEYLSVLSLKGNLLNELTFMLHKQAGSLLSLVDLQYIYHYYSQVTIYISPSTHTDLNLKVSDSVLCCMVPRYVKCSSTEQPRICFGIISGDVSKISCYCVSILVLLVVSSLFTKQIRTMICERRKEKRTYSTLLVNMFASTVLISIYFIGLATADIFEINIIVLRKGYICLFLNSILYISLENLILFKAGAVVVVVFKIIFPFKHQCMWLKWTGLIVFFLWILITITHLFNIYSIRFTNNLLFDNLCSIMWCNILNNVNHSQITMMLIDSISIVLIFAATSTAYMSLRKQQQHNLAQSSIKRSPILITCKLIFPNVTEIVFRCFLLTMFTVKFAGSSYPGDHCTFFILFVTPLNIISTCLIYLAK